jgi:glucose/arabinose dehydrogenase
MAAAQESASPSPTAADASPEPVFDPDAVAIRLVPVVTGLVSPVSVAHDGSDEGLLYVVERGGVIRVLAADGIRSDPLLDISEMVGTGGELGLHDVAFHPRFARNGRFYVHYNDLQGDSRIDEFRVRRGRLPADPGTRRRILEVEQPFINNNGGWLAFGPDGFLYLALGDGGGPSPGDPSGYGQRRDTLLAKILRLDVDRGRRYAIPRDNPFTSRRQRRVFAPETWVWGLRDPRRASFDRETGDLWIGDVGQDRYEEIDLVPAGESGQDFGWSDMEGDRCHLLADCDPADYSLPVHVYDRAPPQCGVVGGHVYRGAAIPALVGAYLFSDVCSGVIWALDAEAVRRGEDVTAAALLDAPQGFRAFGEDEAGELYLTSLDGGVYRIEAEDTR